MKKSRNQKKWPNKIVKMINEPFVISNENDRTDVEKLRTLFHRSMYFIVTRWAYTQCKKFSIM